MKKFNLMQLFSIADGRLLNAGMESVYDVLNWVFNENFTTIALPMAMDKLNEINPQWLQDVRAELFSIKSILGNNDFETIMNYIESNNSVYEIPQVQ